MPNDIFIDIFIYEDTKYQAMGKKESDESEERPHFIAKAPMKRLMKEQGAEIIGNSALSIIIDEIERVGKDITKLAIQVMKDKENKKLMAEDIKFAFYELGYGDRIKDKRN